MPVIDVLSATLQSLLIAIEKWVILVGFYQVLRFLVYEFDKMIVQLCGRVYVYFMLLLKGRLFNDSIISTVTTNVYMFLGIFIFFRLAILFMNIIIEKSDNSSEMLIKLTGSDLIKRVVISCLIITLTPIGFKYANSLQTAVIEDNVIENIFVKSPSFKEYSKTHTLNGGKYIASYVLGGFIHPRESATIEDKNNYKTLFETGDPSVISINSGSVLGVTLGFHYEYYFIISTVCLVYVLKILIGYALDIITIYLRNFFYSLCTPFVALDYIINGKTSVVLESFKKGILCNYLGLFFRLFSIWLTIFILSLMGDGRVSEGTLLATNDHLLKSIIVICVLGFMKDLPGYVGKLFNLDLTQSGSAMGLLESSATTFGAVAGGAAMFGGAQIGKGIGGIAKTTGAGLKNSKLGQNLAKKLQGFKTKFSPKAQERFKKFGDSLKGAKEYMKGDLGEGLESLGNVAVQGSGILNSSAQLPPKAALAALSSLKSKNNKKDGADENSANSNNLANKTHSGTEHLEKLVTINNIQTMSSDQLKDLGVIDVNHDASVQGMIDYMAHVVTGKDIEDNRSEISNAIAKGNTQTTSNGTKYEGQSIADLTNAIGQATGGHYDNDSIKNNIISILKAGGNDNIGKRTTDASGNVSVETVDLEKLNSSSVVNLDSVNIADIFSSMNNDKFKDSARTIIDTQFTNNGGTIEMNK